MGTTMKHCPFGLALLSSLVLSTTISVPSIAAHFNCATAQHPNKKLICANKELSELDDQENELFNDLWEHYSSRTKLQETEWQWGEQLLHCGNNFICTKKLYRERIKQLSAMLVTAKEAKKDAKKISEWKQNLILTVNRLPLTRQSTPPPDDVIATVPSPNIATSSPGAAREAPLRVVNVALRIDKNGFVTTALVLSNIYGDKQDEALDRVRMMQPFAPPPKEWKGRSIDVMVPIGPDPRLDFDAALRFSAPDTSPNISELLTLLESAQKGEATSQYLLGKKYLDGGEVSRNVSEAISWLEKAAEEKHAESEYLLGTIYESGVGISPDVKKAISWFRKAADHGHAAAKASLARIIQPQ
jgi:uncharacterized protein